MKSIHNQTFDKERALYGSQHTLIKNCVFDGPADGESALKECANIEINHCLFNLRYPFWHNQGLKIKDSELTPHCRAALWYSDQVEVAGTKLHGIKALRECHNVVMEDCDILSPEFGWSVEQMRMSRCTAESEYFMMRSKNLSFTDVRFKGKYSFQYVEDALFENCVFDTKDAFWHSRNVTVKNCLVKGEYLAWYSDGLTLINCTISGTQPLCYCKNLTLIDCKMIDADFSFEKSDVYATILTPIDSIKNPLSGKICVPAVGKIIMDDHMAQGEIVVKKPESGGCPGTKTVCA